MGEKEKIGSLFHFTMDLGIGAQLSIDGNFTQDVTVEEMIETVERLKKVGKHFLDQEERKNVEVALVQAQVEMRNIADHLESVREKEDTPPSVITQLENAYRNAVRKKEEAEERLGLLVDATA